MTALGHDATPLTEALVREALLRATPSVPAIDWLARTLALPADEFVRLAAAHFGLEGLPMDRLRACQPDFELLSFVEATQRHCAAVRDGDQTLIVLTDPLDARTRAWAAYRLRARGVTGAAWALAGRGDLKAWLAIAERSLRAMDSVKVEAKSGTRTGAGTLKVSLTSISAAQSPIVRLVDSTIHDALKSDASDIHFESSGAGLAIKYRLDGVLVLIRNVEGLDAAHQALSRIKVIAELDIAERRIPQDGRIKVAIDGAEIDLRVSVMPNLFGEDAVLRILDRRHLTKTSQSLRLDVLGFDATTLAFIRDIAAAPHGLLLATGPTGSGKTTTLYAALSEVNTGLDKIITIEDPVEYQVPGVLQIPVNEKKGLTFARGLRSILRHDPDRVMVGEIRDAETAQIAVQAALTGHLVFTTVHANNVFDVLGRFTHMEVDPYSFAAALNGIVAQRLVRLNCEHCSALWTPTEQQLRDSGLTPETTRGFTFRHGTGCGQCRGTGYKGRTAIAEIMVLNDELREMIVAREPIRALKDVARRGGTRFLRDAAIALVRDGKTSLEEVNRVTFVG